MQKQNHDMFAARIQRLSKTEGGTKQYLAGEGDVKDTTISAGQIKRAQARQGAQGSGNLILAAPKWAMAFMLGAVAMLAGRLIGFHVLGQFIAGGDMMALLMRHGGELAAGIAILVAAATFIGFKGAVAKMAMVAGFGLMLVGEGDVAAQAPMVWEGMFSAQYAATVLSPANGVTENLRTIATVLQSSI